MVEQTSPNPEKMYQLLVEILKCSEARLPQPLWNRLIDLMSERP